MGFFLGTWGNVSMRVPDGILLTPSKVVYAEMQPEDIVLISLDGAILEGKRNPTSEKEVHRQIYLRRQDVNAVIHAHTESAMAASALPCKQIPCIVEEMSQLLGGSIPLTSAYVPAGQHARLGDCAAEALGEKNAVLLRNHGGVCCGRSMDEALLATRVTEKACALYLKAAAVCDPVAIPEEFAASERYRYLYTYGKEKT